MRTAFVLAVIVAALFIASAVRAEVVGKTIEYKDKDVTLEGYVAFDPVKIKAGKAPGVLIVHQWMGLTDYEKRRAGQLAELGYVAFALDIYGKGERPASRAEAGKYAGKYKGDRELFRSRLAAGLAQLTAHDNVDAKRLAAIGYCFGGTGVLEMARMGANVLGVVSFHGGLDAATASDAKGQKPKVLVLHGADDPFVPPAQVEAFMKEMNAGKFDWQMIHYSGAVHSFTQKEAGDDNSTGAAYNAAADVRSWRAMTQLLDEVFAK
jgi:dienelactone hydrolase